MLVKPVKAEDSCDKNHLGDSNATRSKNDSRASTSRPPSERGQEGVSKTQRGEMTLTAQAPNNDNHRRTSSEDLRGDEYDAPAPAGEKNTAGAALTLAESHTTFPEGGGEAWLVVFGSFCAMGAIFGLINSSAVFESYFKTHQLRDYSHSQIGWIFSLYLFLVFFVGLQVGPVFDRHGPRLLVAAGSICIVASLMLLSISTEFYQIILTYSVLGGLGGAMLNAPAYGAIAHYFNARRGLATGIATTAGGIGGIAFPLLLQWLLGKNGVGFGWSCRILGFILLALCAFANAFIKTRLTPNRPKEGAAAAIKGSVWPDLTIFKDKRFALSAVGIFFMEYGLFVPLTYIVSYATAHGFDTSDGMILLAYLNAGSVLGRFLPGILADKLGRFNVIIMTIALCVITTLAVWLPAQSSRATIIAFCVTFGFASGSNLGLIPVCLGQFCSSRDYARYFSTAQMVASFGTLTSVPIGGALLGFEGRTGWQALILFAGLSYIVALTCYTSARVMSVGWQPWKKF
ncbi:monocarboxylate permease-like protein [Purpureocillium lavendulum]|uniref:Monocarboxylate permease-like protein n=1 Tax=Purpureocillium lavendulum TaxID=1247861 RepID=A0AB34FY05_9HYPO|nr:monocarboxylate permease-like protein [Purpureocillium lavendulum]